MSDLLNDVIYTLRLEGQKVIDISDDLIKKVKKLSDENAELKERIELIKKLTARESRGDVSMVIDDSRSGYISAMRCVLYNLEMPIEDLRKE